MFVNPQQAVDAGFITGVKDAAKQVQPNAIDFTLDKLMALSQNDAFVSEGGKSMRKLEEVPVDEDGNWVLEGGRVYDGTSDMFVKVPSGGAALLFTRSTFARNGVFIVSGLYDSGYEGHVGFTIYTIGGSIKIAKGTRIGQMALVTADAAKQYAGGYNHQQGTHYAQPTAMPQQGTGTNVGQRQIASDPQRTETGMGPIVGANSTFL